MWLNSYNPKGVAEKIWVHGGRNDSKRSSVEGYQRDKIHEKDINNRVYALGGAIYVVQFKFIV